VKMLGVSQFILLGYIGGGAIEVVPAAADLNSILGSESWRVKVSTLLYEKRKRRILCGLRL